MGIIKKAVKEVKKTVAKKAPAKKAEKKATFTYPDLKCGDKGEVVTQLQDFLVRDGSKVKIDGVYGPGTQSAVRAFQNRHGLPVTGAVNKKTWNELLKVIKK